MLNHCRQIAREWLMWPERWRECNGPPWSTVLSSQHSGLSSEQFYLHLLERNRDVKADDVRQMVKELESELKEIAKHKPPLAALYDAVLDEDGVSIGFDAGIPLVLGPPSAFERWSRTIDFFDPDNFVALALARIVMSSGRSRGDQIEAVLDEWPLVVSPGDGDLRRLAKRGISDMHLHFKSLWPVPLSWQRVVRHESQFEVDGRKGGDGIELGRADAYTKPKKAADLPNPAQRIERDRVKVSAGLLIEGAALAALRGREIAFLDPDSLTPRQPRDILKAERRMLTRAWMAILAGTAGSARIACELENYLLGKSLYRARHLQSFDQSNPGLVAFDVKRRHNSGLGRMAEEETTGGGFSHSRFRRNNGLLISSLLECRTLRRAELRIAPPRARPIQMAAMYGRLMSATHALLKDLRECPGYEHAPDVDIRFAIHFKRQLSDKTPSDRRFLLKLMEYDLETASLQEFRHRAMSQVPSATGSGTKRSLWDQCSLIGRVDLASPERGSGPWLVAPYIRMLRGDGATIAEMRKGSGNPYIARWNAIAAQDRMNLAMTAPHLGITCHAGEDFYTLLDGLWHIDAAIETWHMGPGDGIGHALALGLSPTGFQQARLPSVRLPRGLELDSLVWLWRLLRDHDEPMGDLGRNLEGLIVSKAVDCYLPHVPSLGGGQLTLEMMLSKIDRIGNIMPATSELALHRLPVSNPLSYFGSLAIGDQLRVLDIFHPEVAKWRASFTKPDPIHVKLEACIEAAQRIIRQKLRGRGIIIETNPSSNLRMELASRISTLPIFDLLGNSLTDIRVTICTDNPGTYDVTAEGEYALVFAALLEKLGYSERDSALAVLEKMRSTGMDLMN